MHIIFENETNFKNTDDLLKLFETITNETFQNESFSKDVEISLTFTTDERIREINLEYRNIDKKTDVLSFPQFNRGELIQDNDSLGDIVISVETAIAQATEYNHSLTREFCFLYCHSLLHLLGYDHMDNEAETEMFLKQDQILNKVGIKR